MLFLLWVYILFGLLLFLELVCDFYIHGIIAQVSCLPSNVHITSTYTVICSFTVRKVDAGCFGLYNELICVLGLIVWKCFHIN